MLSLHHWKDSHMKPNGVIHYDFNFFGLTLPLQKLAFVPRFSSKILWIYIIHGVV